MPLCTCGHEQHEHAAYRGDHHDHPCTRCDCRHFAERPVTTQSNWDIPVSQGARDLMGRLAPSDMSTRPTRVVLDTIDILAAADERDVRNLLWARRAGKL